MVGVAASGQNQLSSRSSDKTRKTGVVGVAGVATAPINQKFDLQMER
jgi:hypothetical protein